MTMEDTRTYDCDKCGHAYTERYGRWTITGWSCLTCLNRQQVEKDRDDRERRIRAEQRRYLNLHVGDAAWREKLR